LKAVKIAIPEKKTDREMVKRNGTITMFMGSFLTTDLEQLLRNC